jgi:hypothetical protein
MERTEDTNTRIHEYETVTTCAPIVTDQSSGVGTYRSPPRVPMTRGEEWRFAWANQAHLHVR